MRQFFSQSATVCIVSEKQPFARFIGTSCTLDNLHTLTFIVELCITLGVNHAIIHSFSLQKAVMRSFLHYFALIEHDNSVGVSDCG